MVKWLHLISVVLVSERMISFESTDCQRWYFKKQRARSVRDQTPCRRRSDKTAGALRLRLRCKNLWSFSLFCIAIVRVNVYYLDFFVLRYWRVLQVFIHTGWADCCHTLYLVGELRAFFRYQLLQDFRITHTCIMHAVLCLTKQSPKNRICLRLE